MTDVEFATLVDAIFDRETFAPDIATHELLAFFMVAQRDVSATRWLGDDRARMVVMVLLSEKLAVTWLGVPLMRILDTAADGVRDQAKRLQDQLFLALGEAFPSEWAFANLSCAAGLSEPQQMPPT